MPNPKRRIAAISFALLLPCPFAAAHAETQDGLALARAKVCLSCHQVEARRVGPPFNAIAERYAQGDAQATEAYLAQGIREGSRGKWGALTMPAQAHVSEADARALARWILSLDKAQR
ncbi:c-type cytochrome [Verticiella sediminum]|uniref:C-type cytochrome n=1 Tax=Verticiella sediminum TaxID=1247510 RepID=A0A556AMU0_9BURK|nr:c-type cytochrome [Verticiella sediminum]TSH94206.1 c-type cytochrome [Verticiella sediminum]